MIPAGYMAKRIVSKPDGMQAEGVRDIYSVSHCISDNFTDYVRYFRHNGYWLFDSPEAIGVLAQENAVDLSGTTMLYYEVHELQFDETQKAWGAFKAEGSFATVVEPPAAKHLVGFDVVSFSAGTSPECSPLSCNLLAGSVAVNQHCLFDSFAEAQKCLESGAFENAEPGPYRIFAVYSI